MRGFPHIRSARPLSLFSVGGSRRREGKGDPEEGREAGAGRRRRVHGNREKGEDAWVSLLKWES